MKELIAIVMPVYNEQNTVGYMLKKTKQVLKEYNYIIIVVNDGSTDETHKILKKTNGIIYARHIINLGKGMAIKTGAEIAIKNNAEIIINIDADNQHNPEDIIRVIKRMKRKRLDILFCSRQLNSNMPLIFRVGNKILSSLLYYIYKIKISDSQSGFRAFTSKAYKKIRWSSSGYSVESEMIVKTAKNKLKYEEMGIETVYNNKFKGTTVMTGIMISIKMLLWRVK